VSCFDLDRDFNKEEGVLADRVRTGVLGAVLVGEGGVTALVVSDNEVYGLVGDDGS
jgi:hypothetical protein